MTWKTTYNDFSNYIGDKNILAIGATYVRDKYPWESAGLFWSCYKNINSGITEQTTVADVTIKLNGGTTALEEREPVYKRACEAIK